MYKNNSQDSSKIRGCSPLKLHHGLTGSAMHSATTHTQNVVTNWRKDDVNLTQLIIMNPLYIC